jgi:hypothetical protein
MKQYSDNEVMESASIRQLIVNINIFSHSIDVLQEREREHIMYYTTCIEEKYE